MIEILGSSGMYVVIGIIVIAVASLFGLVVFASKEEKFEDVVEAQKKEQEALLQSLNTTTSKPSKSKKKWAKIKNQKSAKSGEKKDAQNDEPEAERVEENVSEASAEISLPSTESQSKKATKKRKGNEKAKGKNNVDGKKREALEELIEQAEFQFESKEPESVIEPEKKPKESKKDAPKNIVSEMIAEIKETAELSQAPAEVIEKEKPSKPTESIVTQKKSKAKKSKSQAVSSEDKIAADKIAKDLENSQFNAPDVQRLIDILLDKQNELQQWQMPNKKIDVVEDLRNKCHDLEEQLTEEKKTSLAAAHESKELRLEIQHERSQFQKFQTQANQKITQQGGEIQALQKRMEMTQESHLHEMQKAQSQLQQMKEVIDQSAPVEMQRLKEENAMLKNASLRSQQLSDEKNSLVAEYAQIQQSSKNLRAELDSALMQLQQHSQQMQLYEEQNKAHENEIQKLRISKNETENILSSKVAELKDQLVRYEMEHNNLQQKLQVAQDQLEGAKLEKETLVTKSADSSMLEQKLASSMKDIESLAESLKTSEEKLKQYQEVEIKNSELLKQLAEEKQQLQDKIKQEKDEMVIIEKPPSNGLSSDVQVSQEEHLQLITEKDKVISELKDDVRSTKEELERLIKVMEQEKHDNLEMAKDLTHSNHHLEDKFSHLQKDFDELKAEKKKLEEVVEQSKTKNNDLREKNWKAMDALSTAEANSKKKIKETEETVFRVLKKIRPAIKLERNQPLDVVLQHYQEAFLRGEEELKESAKNSEEVENLTKERDELKDTNEELKEQLNESKKTETSLNQQLKEASSSAENMKKLSEENIKANVQIEHYKEVLEETEGMLKKLQTGVESQVASYEKKLTEKDHELQQLKDKTIRLEETLKNNDDKTQLELDLKNIQSDLESERKAKLELESELDEVRKKMTDMESHLEISHSEDSLAQSQSEGHDDAKHQLSAVQEQLSKIEAEKTELAKKLGSVSDSALAKDEEIKKLKTGKESVDKELAKLKEKYDIIDKAGKGSGKSDKEKDKIIAKLTLENAELREDLRDERDRVVVDVESADTEQLKSDLDSLKQKYEEEKDSSKKLNTSLHELEEQLKNQKEELEKKSTELTEWEQKYKEAADQAVVNEQKIKSGNSPTSPQRTIGAPLLEQLEEVKSSLSQKEQQLENEKLANKQLRAQLAALTSHASHGTSV